MDGRGPSAATAVCPPAQFTPRAPQSLFLKGCKWSPDGTTLATAADDGAIRLFDLPEELLQGERAGARARARARARATPPPDPRQRPPPSTPAEAPARPRGSDAGGPPGDPPAGRLSVSLAVDGGECVYDYAWHPRMSPDAAGTCVLATTGRGLPVHARDAVTGELRGSYVAHDDKDDPTSAFSVSFNCDGSELVCGFKDCVRVFDLDRPGRRCTAWPTHRRRAPAGSSIPGIVSCAAHSSVWPDVVAVGSYGGGLGLLDGRAGGVVAVWEGHRGGVTQVSHGACGSYVYSGARADPEVKCWDPRTGGCLYAMARDSGTTNQRIGFSVEPVGRHLVTGGEGGSLTAFDLTTGERAGAHGVARDVVNGVSVHPWLPVVAVATGTRRLAGGGGGEEGGEGEEAGGDWSQNSVSLWRFPSRGVEV